MSDSSLIWEDDIKSRYILGMKQKLNEKEDKILPVM